MREKEDDGCSMGLLCAKHYSTRQTFSFIIHTLMFTALLRFQYMYLCSICIYMGVNMVKYEHFQDSRTDRIASLGSGNENLYDIYCKLSMFERKRTSRVESQLSSFRKRQCTWNAYPLLETITTIMKYEKGRNQEIKEVSLMIQFHHLNDSYSPKHICSGRCKCLYSKNKKIKMGNGTQQRKAKLLKQ